MYAFVARCAMHRGDLQRAREYVARAARLRPLLSYALPVVSAQTLLELARCYISLGDTGGARAVLRQAQDIFHQRPDLGDLPRQADELRTTLASDPAVMRRSLLATTPRATTPAPLLPTHLTLGEIGERLHVTRNTVKTQAIAIDRKFGVSSRRAAISRMHELGLLPGE